MCIDGLNSHDNPAGKNKVSLLQWKDYRTELKNGQNIEVNVFKNFEYLKKNSIIKPFKQVDQNSHHNESLLQHEFRIEVLPASNHGIL